MGSYNKIPTIIFFWFCTSIGINEVCFGQEIINNPEKGIWQDRVPVPITFELEEVFGSEFSEENEIFFSSAKAIWEVDTDEDGNVYVLDIDLPMLAKFSPDGILEWKRDRKGRGPGDLENAYSLAVSNSIYISNIRGTRIDVIDKQGNFIKSVSLDHLGKDSSYDIVGVLEDKFLVLNSEIVGSIGVEVHVLEIDNGFSLVSEFKVTEDPGVSLPANASILSQASIADSTIIITKNLSYGVQYYSFDGKLIKEINRKFPRFMRPGIYNPGRQRGVMVALGGVFIQYKISRGYLINYVVWPEDIENIDKVAQKMSEGNFPVFFQKNSIDIYSPTGKLLYSKEGQGSIPEIGKLIHTDNEGFLYTVAKEPFPQIRKYRVVLEE